jgi:L-iditol 2-dehydrogenase
VRVARTVALGETRVEEVPDPVCGPGEVVCRVLACATCGSDVMDFYVERKLPAVLGHEPAGEVVEVGPGVTGVSAGDRVAIHHHAPCGACERCARGHETLCAAFRATSLDPGGFAEYVRVPAGLVDELLALDGLDPVAATVTEPLGCALRAQDRAGLGPDDALLVVGAGCSGLLQVAAARARGVRRVLVAERDAARLERAVRWGAEPYGGEAPADVAIVCTHSTEAIAAGAAALSAGGTLCLYAPTAPGVALPVEGWDVFARELRVTASWSAGPRDMREALALLQAGAVATGELITAEYDLGGTGAALAAQRSGAVLKAVVRP